MSEVRTKYKEFGTKLSTNDVRGNSQSRSNSTNFGKYWPNYKETIIHLTSSPLTSLIADQSFMNHSR